METSSPSYVRLLPDKPESLFVFNGNGQMVMYDSVPVVTAYIKAPYLHYWIQTIEKAIDEEPNLIQVQALQSLLIFLRVCEENMKRDHQAILDHQTTIEPASSNGPTNADFDEYLMYYLRSISMNESLVVEAV